MDMITSASPRAWAAVGVGIFIAALFFKIIFGDFEGFIECVRYWFQSGFISQLTSALRGEDGMERQWGELKLFVWIALSVGCGILAYYQLPGWLPGLFG
jgi:hypothetical protein